MRALINEAARLGVTISVAHIEGLDENLLGYYDHDSSEVVVEISLTHAQKKAVIAHELGHAYYSHECGGKRNERQANRYAAELLVDPVEYATAERLNDSPEAIARELDVTPEIVKDYRLYCLQRIGRRTYGRSWRVGISGKMAAELAEAR